MVFLALLIIPALVALSFFLFSKHQVTWKEFLIHLGCQCVVAGISIAVIYWQDTSDTEVWNGRVEYKKQQRVSCSHSYPCNCRQVRSCSGSGKNRSCSSHTVCDTCYEHSHDYDWVLGTTNKERIRIRRVDRQGVKEPSRFTKATVGDPTAVTHSYTNYLKGASDTLFKRQGLIEKYKGKLPKYPMKVHDYHYVNRIVGFVPDKWGWNAALQELNADLGKKKQSNVIIVTTKEEQPFALALEQHWLGGKKNDIVVVLGLENKTKIRWAHVLAWTDKSIVKIKLRDAMTEIGVMEKDKVFPAIKEIVAAHYVRKPMKDFEYLKSSITPSVTQWIVSMLIGLFVSIGLGFFFWKNEFTSNPRKRRYYY